MPTPEEQFAPIQAEMVERAMQAIDLETQYADVPLTGIRRDIAELGVNAGIVAALTVMHERNALRTA